MTKPRRTGAAPLRPVKGDPGKARERDEASMDASALKQKHVRLDESVIAEVNARSRAQGVSFGDYVAGAVIDRLRHDAGQVDTPDPVNVRINQVIEALTGLTDTVHHDYAAMLEMMQAIFNLARGDSSLIDRPVDELRRLEEGERIVDPRHADAGDGDR